MSLYVDPDTRRAAVEALARFLFEHHENSEDETWDEWCREVQDKFRDRASALLHGVSAMLDNERDW